MMQELYPSEGRSDAQPNNGIIFLTQTPTHCPRLSQPAESIDQNRRLRLTFLLIILFSVSLIITGVVFGNMTAEIENTKIIGIILALIGLVGVGGALPCYLLYHKKVTFGSVVRRSSGWYRRDSLGSTSSRLCIIGARSEVTGSVGNIPSYDLPPPYSLDMDSGGLTNPLPRLPQTPEVPDGPPPPYTR